jgi:glutamate---cysteine ligase / carboxylate-amine ligase
VHIDFSSSARTSLGVEWELELVDRQTRELTPVSDAVLADISEEGDGVHPKAKHELFQSCVEVITGICQTVGEATEDIAGTARVVRDTAAAYNAAIMCSGTHPFTDWTTQPFTENARYADLIEHHQWMSRQLQIFGVHVHCGVRSPQKAIPIVNALLQYVPHFLALSGSSPFWIGCDTGLASFRSKLFEGLPTAGLPYQLADWEAFESYLSALISARAISSIREVWWDIRPHPGVGTVELRICDGVSTLREIASITALSQCLVERFDRQLDQGYTLPMPPPWLVRENKWRAARYGLDAEIIIDSAGTTRPVAQSIEDLVEELLPLARRLDCARELAEIPDIVRGGVSYQRQRRVAAEHDGDLVPVVDALVDEMEASLA